MLVLHIWCYIVNNQAPLKSFLFIFCVFLPQRRLVVFSLSVKVRMLFLYSYGYRLSLHVPTLRPELRMTSSYCGLWEQANLQHVIKANKVFYLTALSWGKPCAKLNASCHCWNEPFTLGAGPIPSLSCLYNSPEHFYTEVKATIDSPTRLEREGYFIGCNLCPYVKDNCMLLLWKEIRLS